MSALLPPFTLDVPTTTVSPSSILNEVSMTGRPPAFSDLRILGALQIIDAPVDRVQPRAEPLHVVRIRHADFDILPAFVDLKGEVVTFLFELIDLAAGLRAKQRGGHFLLALLLDAALLIQLRRSAGDIAVAQHEPHRYGPRIRRPGVNSGEARSSSSYSCSSAPRNRVRAGPDVPPMIHCVSSSR